LIPRASAAAVLLLLRGEVGLAAAEMAQPAADLRRLLRVVRIGMRGVRGFEEVEGADVLAEELQADGPASSRPHRAHRRSAQARVAHAGSSSYY